MRFAVAALAGVAFLALAACASAPKPAAVVPADLVRPPCRPSPALMAAPEPLPPIRPGERMPAVSARDTVAYNALRRVLADLQAHVRAFCQ